jgi:hypothetical protein
MKNRLPDPSKIRDLDFIWIFGDSKSRQFQRLSASIGRFFSVRRNEPPPA